MDFLKSFLRNKTTRFFLVVLAIGIVIVVLPFLTTPEDSEDAIGPGLTVGLGIIIAVVAIFGICISAIHSKSGKFSVSILLTGLLLLVPGLIGAPLLNKAEMANLYGCPRIINDRVVYSTDTEKYIKNYEYCQNLKGAPGAQIDYKNNFVIMGAALLLVGSLYATVTHRPRKR